jgi:hypothetical protein
LHEYDRSAPLLVESTTHTAGALLRVTAMKMAIAGGLLVILALVGFNQSIGPTVGPDTPVITRTAEPVKVFLPADPDAKTISGYVYGALGDAASATGGELGADLRSLAEDRSLLDWISTSGEPEFAGDRAAALAYPVYRVNVSADRVTITSATVELLPPYWNIGSSIAHEDGHALINSMLAEACGEAIVRERADAGERGSSLGRDVENALYGLGNRAHGLYHGAVNDTRYPRYAQAARDAATTVIDGGC